MFLIAAVASMSVGAQTITLSPPKASPTTIIAVKGAGLPPNTLIAVAFDTTAEASVLSNASGAFQTNIPVPSNAQPGIHQVVAESGTATLASAKFLVRTDWPQFGFVSAGGRWNPFENTLDVSSATRLQQRWSFATGGQVAEPVLANGVLYVGSWDQNLYALNASTGAKLWSFPTGNGATIAPAVANGVVYGSNDTGIFALNATTGAELWSFATGGGSDGLTVAAGVVYSSSGSPTSTLYAVNASTGALLWSFASGADVVAAPAVANGFVYLPSTTNAALEEGRLFALDASTGAQVWYADVGATYASPAVANGVVYVALWSPGGLAALNANTGATLWTVGLFSDNFECAPAIANGVVYLGSAFAVYAFNASTGATLWRYTRPTGTMFVTGSLAVANGVVYVCAAQLESLYALNATTGALLKRFSIAPYRVNSSPVVANGMVYFGSFDGPVYALGLPLKGPLLADAGSDPATEE